MINLQEQPSVKTNFLPATEALEMALKRHEENEASIFVAQPTLISSLLENHFATMTAAADFDMEFPSLQDPFSINATPVTSKMDQILPPTKIYGKRVKRRRSSGLVRSKPMICLSDAAVDTTSIDLADDEEGEFPAPLPKRLKSLTSSYVAPIRRSNNDSPSIPLNLLTTSTDSDASSTKETAFLQDDFPRTHHFPSLLDTPLSTF